MSKTAWRTLWHEFRLLRRKNPALHRAIATQWREGFPKSWEETAERYARLTRAELPAAAAAERTAQEAAFQRQLNAPPAPPTGPQAELFTVAPTSKPTTPGRWAVGDRVRIEKVKHPELEHHAKYIGKTGTVTRVYKTRPFIEVKLDLTGRTWEASPDNLAALMSTTQICPASFP
jgi:hypothetical protein